MRPARECLTQHSAVRFGNHTKGQSSTRDPLLLVVRGWSVLGVTVGHALREGARCNVCSRA